MLKEIPISAWPTNHSNAYDLFKLSSFNENGCKFPKKSFPWLGDKIRSQDLSLPLPDYFWYCLFECACKFSHTHLNCCSCCGVKSHYICVDKCSDCPRSDRFFNFCPDLLRWLHEPDTSHNLHWNNIVRDCVISCPPPHFKA